MNQEGNQSRIHSDSSSSSRRQAAPFNQQRPYPVKFYPIPKERIWGGHSLKAMFSQRSEEPLPNAPVGEYWILSGHPNGTSVVSNGPYQGRSLVELTEAFPADYLGNSVQPRFPLLIKVLEASSDLSVQVHPSDELAEAIEGDYGKTEAWYVLECKPDGTVVYGHNFPSKEALKQAFLEGTIGRYLRYEAIKPKQTVFVPSGTLHALLAGTKVIEVQQTSDVTYRVYDWDRVGQDGSPRELHIDKAARVLFDDQVPNSQSSGIDGGNSSADTLHEVSLQSQEEKVSPPCLVVTGGETQLLVDCPYFRLHEWTVTGTEGASLNRSGVQSPDILIVVEGTGFLSWGDDNVLELAPGDTCLIPTSLEHVDIRSEMPDGALQLLIARY